MTDLTPTVRFSPCHAFEYDGDTPTGACAACGWLEEDHWRAEAYLAGRRPVGLRG